MKNIILGIDTGGTYTDGVLIKCNTQEVIRTAKAFTTKGNLSLGIMNCIDKLHIETDSICLVCLSTTLATNAVVENNKVNVGLIVIDKSGFVKNKKKYPAQITRYVSGKMDILGREARPLNKDEVRTVLDEMKGKVDSLAISGFASIKNPTHETMIKDEAERILNVPVVCAHELTATLGFYERTVTAALNARLIPLICGLISDTEKALADRNISAPITMVKGDGHSMISDYARTCPIETVLSGPAASAIGGRFLTGEKNAVIVDMGGTTTDIVCIDNCEAFLEKDGMNIEGWKTRVKSVKVSTFGLGGDSYIKMDSSNKISFGPRRVRPICVAAYEHPYICDELKNCRLDKDYLIINRQETDFIYLLGDCKYDNNGMTQQELNLLDMLKSGPHSVVYLAQELNTDIDSLNIDTFVDMGLVGIISLTPTDLLHASGEYEEWNEGASKLAIKIFADRLGLTTEECLKYTEDSFVNKVCRCIIESAIEIDGLESKLNLDSTANYVFNKWAGDNSLDHYSIKFKLNRPIIGIGAPAPVWIGKAARVLKAKFIIPEYNCVANAIGAAVGDVRERIEAVICYDQFFDNYVAYIPGERRTYSTLKEAKEGTANALHDYVRDFAIKLGVKNPEVIFDIEDFEIDDVCTGGKTFVKSTLYAIIEGDFKKGVSM